MKWFEKVRRLCRSTKGAVLVETAFVSFLLMSIVIGMGVVAMKGQELENRGRLSIEVADYMQVLLVENEDLAPQSQDAILDMARARFAAAPQDVRVNASVVARSRETGAYEVERSWSLGPYDAPARIEVENEGIGSVQIGSESVTLDLGERMLFVETVVRFTGMPKGTSAPRAQRSWALAPLKDAPLAP